MAQLFWKLYVNSLHENRVPVLEMESWRALSDCFMVMPLSCILLLSAKLAAEQAVSPWSKDWCLAPRGIEETEAVQQRLEFKRDNFNIFNHLTRMSSIPSNYLVLTGNKSEFECL